MPPRQRKKLDRMIRSVNDPRRSGKGNYRHKLPDMLYLEFAARIRGCLTSVGAGPVPARCPVRGTDNRDIAMTIASCRASGWYAACRVPTLAAYGRLRIITT